MNDKEAFSKVWNDWSKNPDATWDYGLPLEFGFKRGLAHRDEQIKVLVEALEKIASSDFRGNRPSESLIAEEALAKFRREKK